MKTMLLLCIALFNVTCIWAQQNISCSFDRLFNLKEGLSKEAIADSIKNIYGLEPFTANAQTKGNLRHNTANTIKTSLIYKIGTTACFNGNNTKLQFEFINNKLQKAYLQTAYAGTDYYEMLENFKTLRNIVKPGWEREKENKISSGELVSVGYYYSKPKDKSYTSDKLSLQYIHTKPDKGYGIYLLQLAWINTENTGIETIMY